MKNNNTNHIPDINVIDLEHDGKPITSGSDQVKDHSEKNKHSEQTTKKGFRALLNIHVILFLVFVIFIVCLVLKFKNWGERIDISQIQSNNNGEYYDVLDQILPLLDTEGHPVSTEKADTIVCFGNAPFADDRDSEDNLANLIAKETGATVYNCSVSGSYLAAQWPHFSAVEAPMDAYGFYWLVTLAATDGLIKDYYGNADIALGDDCPPEAQEVVDLLLSIDFNEVDVITIMYDASDYLMGHAMYDDANSTNIEYFTGNLEAGIALIQENYPHIRIIVMSPTYAYAIDENSGEYVNSDMYIYNDRDVLSTYVIMESASCSARGVTFIDHLYGTITEANADKYLSDNVHLNLDGRRLVLSRFMDALTRYNK